MLVPRLLVASSLLLLLVLWLPKSVVSVEATSQDEETLSSSSSCSPVLSCSELRELANKHFPSEYVTDMICIAYFESSWCAGAYDASVANKTALVGLWQIEEQLSQEGCIPSSQSTETLLDPDLNAKCAAYRLQHDPRGLDSWPSWSLGYCANWSRCVADNNNSTTTRSPASSRSDSGPFGPSATKATASSSGTSGHYSSTSGGYASSTGSTGGGGSRATQPNTHGHHATSRSCVMDRNAQTILEGGDGAIARNAADA
eukprot:TRINITY_DN7468_c0_g1_i1.p1 TRINITY_DN7468_c0_g1~~TRINITY_DN7468_c0_g1_i1.p1  ORF type:complete len:258 (-),score=44.76 TRINITY_DN7468_c0_g1_i1:100-873(-)